MTRYVGAVIFGDSTRLYLVYDGATDAAMRPLFASEQAARSWLAQGAPPLKEPGGAKDAEEAVTLIVDVEIEKQVALGQNGKFASRASRKCMWLTGPRSFMEMIYQNGATASRVF